MMTVMGRRIIGLAVTLLWGVAFLSLARAEFPTERPYPGIIFHSETRKDPAMKLFWVEIDLSDPHVSIRVSAGGPDPDGEGKFQTILMPTSAIAQREHFDLA